MYTVESGRSTVTLPAAQFGAKISSGPDAHLFYIDDLSGEIRFNNPPDFNNPIDKNRDNIYELWVASSHEEESKRNISVKVVKDFVPQ